MFARVQQSVESGARLAGVELVHPKEIQEAGNVLEQILKRLDEADAVVAILTGYNPNILFEVGYAAKRAPILIAPDTGKLPFDLRIYRVLRYGEAGDMDTLPQRVAGAIRETLQSAADRIEPPIRDYVAALERRLRTSSSFLPDALRARFRGDLAEHFVPIRLRAKGESTDTTVTPDTEVRSLLAQRTGRGDPGHLLVLGGPGAGKSTLLRFLALHAWSAPQQIGLDREHLPMLVSARSITNAPGIDVPSRLHASLDDDRGLMLTVRPPIDFIAAWSRHVRRPWLFLVDAFDEVMPAQRSEFEGWLREFAAWCGKQGHRLVVTSRPEAAPAAWLAHGACVLQLLPLDEDLQAWLGRSLLVDQADPFLHALHGSRLRTRLRNPLWLVLAAAQFAETSRLPGKRIELVEAMIAGALDWTRETRRWAGIEERIAATARTLLERVALEEDVVHAVAGFLEHDLRMPAVEARARAASVLRDVAAASGLLVKNASTWTFSSLPVLEHFAACAISKKFTTAVEREALVEKWWCSERREIVLAVIGLLDDAREVSRLLRVVVPTSTLSTLLRRNGPNHLARLRFIVDCTLDGIPVDAELRERVGRDLTQRSRDPSEGPAASELLAMLGDSSALEGWLRGPAGSLEDTAYAAAALVLLGEHTALESAACDRSVPDRQRLVALQSLPQSRRTTVAQKVLREPGERRASAAAGGPAEPDNAESFRTLAAVILVRSNDFDALRAVLRDGSIEPSMLDAIVVAAAGERKLDFLFQAAEDEAVPVGIREAIRERLTEATMLLLQQMAADVQSDRGVRLAAQWLLGDAPGPPDLAPLFVSSRLTAGALYAAAAVAISRDPGALITLAGRSDVELRIQRFAIWMTATGKHWDQVEATIGREDLPSDIRVMTLSILLNEDRVRGFLVASRIPSTSAIAADARQVVETNARGLAEVAHDSSLPEASRLIALRLLAQAGRTETLRDIIRGPADDVIGRVALMVAREAGLRSLLEELARDASMDEQMRLVVLTLLADAGHLAEVRAFAASDDMPSQLRTFAQLTVSQAEKRDGSEPPDNASSPMDPADGARETKPV